ncbi:hypothetical protein OIU78_020719 [Salix suchowensis]|nr:hypothetical protein OIU78_020719 [Salix suchowensis]
MPVICHTNILALKRAPTILPCSAAERNSDLLNSGEEGVMGIGGGWQPAYKWSEKIGKDGRKEGGLQRIYLHREGTVGSQQHSVTSSAGFDIPEDEYVQCRRSG